MRKQKHERIEFEWKGGKYKHYNPSNRGLYIVYGVLIAIIIIALILR